MKIMVVGAIGCGKTTLCQYLAVLPLAYAKTQTIGIIGDAIDTPGEYTQNRFMRSRLVVTGVDVNLVLFLQSAVNHDFYFSPGQASMYTNPVIGVITKTDLAEEGDIEKARELLLLAGASIIFPISCLSGSGMEELKKYIQAKE
jgi:ethanolamine utilization protein EutP